MDANTSPLIDLLEREGISHDLHRVPARPPEKSLWFRYEVLCRTPETDSLRIEIWATSKDEALAAARRVRPAPSTVRSVKITSPARRLSEIPILVIPSTREG